MQAPALRSLLQSGEALTLFQATVSPPYSSLPYAKAIDVATNSLESASPPGSLVDLYAQGIAGNGFCEIGELPDAFNGAGKVLLRML